jgi:carboxypeptidase Q
MRLRLCLLLFISIPLCGALAQDTTDRVISEGLKPSALDVDLHRLTDEVGGRVPGTPSMQRAVDWGVGAFKVAGADSVHTENFTLPVSWAEGATEMSVIATRPGDRPEENANTEAQTSRSAPAARFGVRAVSIAWAPALSAQRHVRVIDVGQGTAGDFARAGDVAGALLLVHSEEMKKWDDLFAEYLRAPGIIDRAVAGKSLSIALQSTRPNDLLYRHTNSNQGELDRLPMVLVAREDAGRMARLLASGQTLYADLSIPNRVGGPVTAANVVAELRGTEKPDEIVVLGAHLDSWELGTGALDNGCNAALVVDVLRAIKASGLPPRRTIRFILFSGEEEGLVGSRAYTIAHNSELDNTVAVVVLDAGIGRVTGFSLGGRRDVVDAATTLVAPLKPFDATTLTTDASWGTDNFDFMLQGGPTFVANQQEYNYLLNYHAMSDTFDKVDLAQLKKHVAEAAGLTWGLANSSARPGPRLHHAQIEQTFRETHLDEQLKTLGMWDRWETGRMGRKD